MTDTATTEAANNLPEAIQAASNTIQSFYQSPEYLKAFVGDEPLTGSTEGLKGNLMSVLSLTSSVGSHDVYLLDAYDQADPDAMPEHAGAVLKLMDTEHNTYYADGDGIHTADAFQERLRVEASKGYRLELQPFTPASLSFAEVNQGVEFDSFQLRALTRLTQETIGDDLKPIRMLLQEPLTLTETIQAASESIQTLCQSPEFKQKFADDAQTQNVDGSLKLMTIMALSKPVGSKALYLIDAYSTKEPEEIPIHEGAALKLIDDAQNTYYVDGNGIHKEAEWLAQVIKPIEQDGYKVKLEPFTEASLNFAEINQGAWVEDYIAYSLHTQAHDALMTTLEPLRDVLKEPTPRTVQHILYTDAQGYTAAQIPAVMQQTEALVRKALDQARRENYAVAAITVATLNHEPDHLNSLLPLIEAAQTADNKQQYINRAFPESASICLTIENSHDAISKLPQISQNKDSRLIVISDGKSEGTQAVVKAATELGIKTVGYNPETKAFIGQPAQPAVTISTAPLQPTATTTKRAKGAKDNGR